MTEVVMHASLEGGGMTWTRSGRVQAPQGSCIPHALPKIRATALHSRLTQRERLTSLASATPVLVSGAGTADVCIPVPMCPESAVEGAMDGPSIRTKGYLTLEAHYSLFLVFQRPAHHHHHALHNLCRMHAPPRSARRTYPSSV